MATGIDTTKINGLKITLLDYIELLNALVIRLENDKLLIQNNLDGTAKSEIVNRLDKILGQMPVVKSNINAYIATLNGVVDSFVSQDVQLASTVINIDKLGD